MPRIYNPAMECMDRESMRKLQSERLPLAGQLDMVASFDYFDYAKGFDRERTEVIAGLQYWFFTKCRFQLQYTWASSWTDGLNTAWVDDACSRVQIQMQVAF